MVVDSARNSRREISFVLESFPDQDQSLVVQSVSRPLTKVTKEEQGEVDNKAFGGQFLDNV
jgi:hypothetical protein